jgi:hypothetical protein
MTPVGIIQIGLVTRQPKASTLDKTGGRYKMSHDGH